MPWYGLGDYKNHARHALMEDTGPPDIFMARGMVYESGFIAPFSGIYGIRRLERKFKQIGVHVRGLLNHGEPIAG